MNILITRSFDPLAEQLDDIKGYCCHKSEMFRQSSKERSYLSSHDSQDGTPGHAVNHKPNFSLTSFSTFHQFKQPSAPADTSIQSPPPSRTIAEEDGPPPPPPPPPTNPNPVIPPLCAKRYWTRLVFAFGHQRKMLSSAPPLAITVPSGLHAKHPMRWEWKHHRPRGTMAGYFPQIGNTHRTTFCSI